MGRNSSCGADAGPSNRTRSQEEGRDKLDQAFDGLEAELPERARRVLHWLRSPQARWVRLPVGLLCIAAAFLWFMPIVGLEWLPIGLLLIAQDVPFMRKPVGIAILWLLAQWQRLKAWYRRRRAQRAT